MTTHCEIKDYVDVLNKIAPYKTITTGEPLIRTKFDAKPSTTSDIRADQVLYTLVRINDAYGNIEPTDQTIGSFAGFQASLFDSVTKSKPYYWLTLPKPPHKSVVHEVMIRLLDAIDEKNISFLTLTGDQPVYTLVVQIRNENRDKFGAIIPFLGPFHTQVAFITAISKKMEGSGIADIIVSAGIIADKSVDKAMRAKHFRRIVRAFQLLYEALQRIIRRGIEGGVILSEEIKSLVRKLKNPLVFSKDELRKSVNDVKENEEFNVFIKDVYSVVENSPMGDYWLSFMYMVEVLSMNIHSLKTQNWHLFKDSLRLMIPWLQIYDKVHYGKWLPEFWAEISTLSTSIDLYMKSIFSHSITGQPYSSIGSDLWIELTMNKGSKMKAGWKRMKRCCIHIQRMQIMRIVYVCLFIT